MAFNILDPNTWWENPPWDNPPNTRPQGGTTPGGTVLGAQQRPPTGADYYPVPGKGSSGYPADATTTTPTSTSQDNNNNAQAAYYKYLMTQKTQQPQQDPRNYMAELQYQQQQESARAAAQIEWERQKQQADLEAAKQESLAKLAAQPKSWLEYAALSGKAPVVQPWMLPLMKGDYGITSAGSPIPNWSATDMTKMPDLIPPSAQYMARIGPTADQQLYGYESAVHGATPEETQWRQWSMAPPGSGSYRGLQMQR